MRMRRSAAVFILTACLLWNACPAVSGSDQTEPEVIIDVEETVGGESVPGKIPDTGGSLIEDPVGGEEAGAPAALPDETEAETAAVTPSETEGAPGSPETEPLSEKAEISPAETETETKALLETEAVPGTGDEAPLETETERQEKKAADRMLLSIGITTDRNTTVKNCYVRLKNTASANGVLRDIEQEAALVQTGTSGRKPVFETDVDKLVPGSTYTLTVTIYHFADSVHTVRAGEDGSIFIDGKRADSGGKASMDLTLSAAVWHPRSSMTQVSLTKLNDIDRPSGNSLQGGEAALDYYLAAFNKSSGRNDIALLRLSDLSLIRYANATVALNHANDFAFVPSRNKMFAVNMLDSKHTRIVQLHGTSLSFEKNIDLNYGYHALAYDPGSDCFCALRTARHGTVCDVYDYSFSTIRRSFEMKTNLTRQGASIYQGRLYYVCYEAGGVTSYESVYDRSLNKYDNVIYVYDLYGNLQKIYLVPAPSSSRKFELEDIVFVDGCMILQANDSTSGSARAGFYRVDPVPVSVDISIPVTQNGKAPADGAYKAVLAKNGEAVGTVKNYGGQFSFGAQSVTLPGSYVYTVTEKKGKDKKNYIYDTAPVSIPVSAGYDPFTNRLSLRKGTPSRPAVMNTKLTKRQKKNIKNLKGSTAVISRIRAKKGALKVTCKKMRFGKKKAEGYEVQVCRNKKFKGPSLVTVRSKKRIKNIRDLKRGKKYYVRVRAYHTVGVKTFFSGYSVVSSMRTK